MKSKIINQPAIELVLSQDEAVHLLNNITRGDMLIEKLYHHLDTQLKNIDDIPKSLHHIDYSGPQSVTVL